jgi:phage-related protein
MVATFQNTFAIIRNTISNIPSFFKSVWDGVVNIFKFDWLINGINRAISSLLNMFKPVVDLYNKIAGTVGGATISLPQMPQQKLNNPTGTVQNQSQNNKSLTQDIKIDIKTNDSKTVAPAISKELNKYMADSKNQFNKGGR